MDHDLTYIYAIKRDIVPHGEKGRHWRILKGRGAVRICVTAPIILPGPTIPWALHLPTSLPCGATRASAWTCVAPATCPHHLLHAWALHLPRMGSCGSATWPCVSRHIRACSARHVSFACHVSSMGLAEIKPPFSRF